MATSNGTSVHLGFESKLWDAADHLRSNMDPAEYKHVVLGLLFLKYISDAFEERRDELQEAVADPESEYYVADPVAREAELTQLLEDKDEYTGENVFWVPKDARWSTIKAKAPRPGIGKVVDDAMETIEKENPRLKGALPTIFARPNLNEQVLAKLINTFSDLGLGGKANQEKDVLGRIYEYFLGRFASAEGKGGGEFYTPTSIVRLLVEMLEPYEGRVFDPCCGSGGMFVQSVKFVEAHGGGKNEVSVYGQESNHTTWRLARMNLAIRGIEANLGTKNADSFTNDLHPDLRADYVIANPPFNISQWNGEALRKDIRWTHGVPPEGNANYAWMQHFLHHLGARGTAGYVMANGSLSTMSGGEGEIRQRMVEADLVDCIVALPSQLFYQTQIPVCLWFLAKDKGHRNRGADLPNLRDRTGETLFINATDLGRMDTRVHRVLNDADVEKIAGTYHAWRNEDGDYEDVAGFCKSATLEEIGKRRFALTPGPYVGVAEHEGDGEPFEAKMDRLSAQLQGQLAEASELNVKIENVLAQVGYGI